MKEPEYLEGPETLENFERKMKAIFQVSKADIVAPNRKNAKQPKATSRKERNSRKD